MRAAATILAAIGLAVFLLWPASQGETVCPPAVGPPAPRGHARPERRGRDGGAPSDPVRLAGPTPFARRIALDYYLADVAGGEGLRLARRYLLSVDPPVARRSWRELLPLIRMEHVPRRVPGERRVRFWTLDGRYPADARLEAEHLVELWLSFADVELPGGIDVLATPEMGREVFPGLDRPKAAGLYFPADRLAVVRTRMNRKHRRRTLKHELAHAVAHALDARFARSRFVGEGLAEYLSLGRFPDGTIGIPPGRLADGMALLDRILTHWEGRGGRFRSDWLRLWVDLPPFVFYRFGWFGYLLATGAVAHAGPETVADALARRDLSVLADAIREADWDAFRSFVRRAGRRGTPEEAVVVWDGGNEKPPPPLWKRHGKAVGFPPDLPGKVYGMPSVAELLRGFREPSDEPIVVIVDLSRAMDVNHGRWTGREWTRRLLEQLGDVAVVSVLGLTDTGEEVDASLHAVRPWDPARLPRTTRAKRLVICTTGGEADRWDPERRLDELGRIEDHAGRRALVVDLGIEPSPFVKGLAHRCGGAYWRPDALPERVR